MKLKKTVEVLVCKKVVFESCFAVCTKICKKKSPLPPKPKPGAINLTTTSFYGFGNTSNSTIIYLSVTNSTNVSLMH